MCKARIRYWTSSIRVRPQILEFLRQDSEAYAPLDETRSRLFTLAKELS